ncbi:MAG TPA: hypothetical protein VKT78_02960, partial [Fimbriimonadaceae bacterium]|nr:hypothetical protein [Fimbriimonadaceae bacterium]
LVRVGSISGQGSKEEWWSYRLADGRAIERTDIARALKVDRVTTVLPLPGTQLLLVDGFRFDSVWTKETEIVTLLDPENRSVWNREAAFTLSRKNNDEEPNVKLGKGPGEFAVRVTGSKEVVHYRASQALLGWTVTRTGAEPFVPAAPAVTHSAPTPPIPSISLPLMRKWTIPLNVKAVSPFADVEAFDFVGADGIAAVREGDKPAILVCRTNGKIEREIPIPAVKSESRHGSFVAWTGGARLILVECDDQRPAWCKAFAVDLKSGVLRGLAKFKGPPVGAVVGFQDGRFAVIPSELASMESSAKPRICRPDGSTERTLDVPTGDIGSHDLAGADADTHGHLVLFERYVGTFVFGLDGKLVKHIPLAAGPTDDPIYYTGICALPDGRFVLSAFSDGPTFALGDGSGKPGTQRSIKFADGKRFEYVSCLKSDSSGHLWASDRHGLYRVNEAGRVVARVGRTPETRGLGRIARLAVKPDGGVIALDEQTAAVSFFDAGGRLASLGTPLKSDFEARPPEYGELHVARSGDVYLGFPTRELHFAPDGRRLGWVANGSEHPASVGHVEPTWHWFNENLLDRAGHVRLTLNRWPDQMWMLAGPSCSAPDGSLMAFGTTGPRYVRRGEMRLAFFSAIGKPEGMTPLPAAVNAAYGAAYDGRMAYFFDRGSVVAVAKKGVAVWRFKLPKPDPDYWELFPSRGGIAAFDGRRTIYWFKTPR